MRNFGFVKNFRDFSFTKAAFGCKINPTQLIEMPEKEEFSWLT